MPDHFFDTSALGKHYQTELGSDVVNQLLEAAPSHQFISRLAVVELHSVLAKKVRTGLLSEADFQALSRRFREDVRTKKFEVIRNQSFHFQTAQLLIRRLGTKNNLRTLDALQLSVALSLRSARREVILVCADQALCQIATLEGLRVINPEKSSP